jgi:hypothetical protein
MAAHGEGEWVLAEEGAVLGDPLAGSKMPARVGIVEQLGREAERGEDEKGDEQGRLAHPFPH